MIRVGQSAGRAQGPLGADDRHDLLDRQLRAGERVPPAAVKLDIPESRADPIVVRARLRGAFARADRRDDPAVDLDLDPVRRLEVSRDDHHWEFTRYRRANGSHSLHLPPTIVSLAGLRHGSSPCVAARRR